ncbi:hypothetical protein D3C72_1677280 [compost metagenome]
MTQIDLFQGEADQLGHPQATGVQHFKHGPVALADGLAQIRRLQQGFHISLGQGLWQRPAELRHINAQCRIDGDHLFPQQVTIKAAHTRKKSRSGTWLVVLLQAPGQVVEYQLAPGIDQLQSFVLQPAVE